MNLDDLLELEQTCDAAFKVGWNGVDSVRTTVDQKVEFVVFEAGNTLALVKSALGYPAYYPVHDVKLETPLRAVLMDLDGTTVHSEHFWIWIIEKAMASLLGDSQFKLEACDEPYVSGHSVSEHLDYCINKYCADKTIEEARDWYFKHTRYEMNEILAGRGKKGAFTPSPGIKEFLYELKSMNVKIGLVTSGLYEKAWPEIVQAFQSLKMDPPNEFYDAVITAGYAIRKGAPGTLGELSLKPHPWLYAETARVGLGIAFKDRHAIVGIEDSGAGVISILLAGFSPIGIRGGNIINSGSRSLCVHYEENLEEILQRIQSGY